MLIILKWEYLLLVTTTYFSISDWLLHSSLLLSQSLMAWWPINSDLWTVLFIRELLSTFQSYTVPLSPSQSISVHLSPSQSISVHLSFSVSLSPPQSISASQSLSVLLRGSQFPTVLPPGSPTPTWRCWLLNYWSGIVMLVTVLLCKTSTAPPLLLLYEKINGFYQILHEGRFLSSWT